MPVPAQVSPIALQLTLHAPQRALVRKSRQAPEQQRIHRLDPHDVPFGRLREQLRFSVELRDVHEPVALQRRSVRVRDCVADSSQPLAQLQPLHDEYVVEPQVTPSRWREQPRLSLVVTTVHMPDMQRGVITERLWVPLSSHVPPVNPAQVLQVPNATAPQSASTTH